MQTTVRTTIRIRKDILDQSKLIAFKKGTSVQEIINSTLALGLGKVSDLDSNKEAMNKIDRFRVSLSNKKNDWQDLLNASKLDLK